MNAIRLALALGAALLAAACLPVTTKAPVGTTAGLAADPALMGTWKGTVADAEGPSYFHFFPRRDGTTTVLLVTPPHGKDDGGWSEFAATTATLGAHHYLNTRSISDNGKAVAGAEAERNIPLSYTIADSKTLTLYLIDEDAAKQAIKAGKIEGEIGKGEYGDVIITAAPDKLDTFFASEDAAKLFTKPLIVLTKQE